MPSMIANPKQQNDTQDTLPSWRKLIFKWLFSGLAILCIPVYFTSVYLCIAMDLWLMAIFDTLVYGILLVIIFHPKLSDKVKFSIGCMLSFSIGAAFLFAIGPSGAGYFWLFAFPPLTSILLGSRASIWAQVLNGICLLVLGLSYHYQWVNWPVIEGYSTVIWYVVMINFIVTNAVVTQSTSFLLGKLSHSLQSTLASRRATVMGLAKLAEYRDNETGAHLLRMQKYAQMLAKQRAQSERVPEELTEVFIDEISLSAILHDIGKVGIADHILLKPGRLTPEEFTQIKAHPVIGEKVLQSLLSYAPQCGFIQMGRDIAGGHHEKWDGSGYPKGLSGEAIPLSARIVALVDVYDALTSPRCYKRPFSHEHARDLILEGKAKHFDPELVDCFIQINEEFAKLSTASLLECYDEQLPPITQAYSDGTDYAKTRVQGT